MGLIGKSDRVVSLGGAQIGKVLLKLFLFYKRTFLFIKEIGKTLLKFSITYPFYRLFGPASLTLKRLHPICYF